jgi:hypothetical protein
MRRFSTIGGIFCLRCFSGTVYLGTPIRTMGPLGPEVEYTRRVSFVNKPARPEDGR